MELEKESEELVVAESNGLEVRRRRTNDTNSGASLEELKAKGAGGEAELRSVNYHADEAQYALAIEIDNTNPETDVAIVIQEELVIENSDFKTNMVNGSNSQYYSKTNGDETTTTESEDEITVHEHTTVLRTKLKAVDIDLERILEEQDTHDLYCPNCSSCITKRVILRKRKRSIRETELPSQPEPEPEPEPDVFRCLACFSFFTQTDGGFNIFRIFEKGKENHVKISMPVSEKKSSWISSLFKVDKSTNKGSEPEDSAIQGSEAPVTEVLLQPAPPIVVANQPGRNSEMSNGWDILKSIVYGGLTESITSLAVVSSAAGAGASTLSVIGLGLANLAGGLLSIIHDLFELRAAQDEAIEQRDQRVGRYWELLGQRANFRLHFIVAVISYILLGLMPPVVYGFSFRKSGDKEYKLIAVTAASFLCIALLAIGKAHVKPRKAYSKTLFYYLSLGISSSAISCVTGVLINRLLDRLGWFDQSTALSPPPALFPREASLRGSAWASY